MSLHPDVFDLIEALNNAPDEVDEGIDHVYAEGVEVDITRLNFACADLAKSVDDVEEDTRELMMSHIDIHKALQSYRRTCDLLVVSVLGLAALEFARAMEWI